MSQPQIEPTLSLAETLPLWRNGFDAQDVVEGLLTHSEYDCVQRIYVGSSFCPQVFRAITTQQIANLARYARARDLGLTLVLPIFSEASLERGMDHAQALLQAADGAIDEVTVNDYGMCAHWGAAIENGAPLKLNLGRLLNKDTRDRRDPLYPTLPYIPRLLERGWQGYADLDRVLQTWPVAGIEFDPTHEQLDLSALPDSVTPALYGPLCYQSCGQICEFASIGACDERKFRPNMPCQLQCLSTSIAYTGATGVEFVKLGRAVYCEGQPTQVVGVTRIRHIFEPTREVLG